MVVQQDPCTVSTVGQLPVHPTASRRSHQQFWLRLIDGIDRKKTVRANRQVEWDPFVHVYTSQGRDRLNGTHLSVYIPAKEGTG